MKRSVDAKVYEADNNGRKTGGNWLELYATKRLNISAQIGKENSDVKISDIGLTPVSSGLGCHWGLAILNRVAPSEKYFHQSVL
jgi:hypothetical protein